MLRIKFLALFSKHIQIPVKAWSQADSDIVQTIADVLLREEQCGGTGDDNSHNKDYNNSSTNNKDVDNMYDQHYPRKFNNNRQHQQDSRYDNRYDNRFDRLVFHSFHKITKSMTIEASFYVYKEKYKVYIKVYVFD